MNRPSVLAIAALLGLICVGLLGCRTRSSGDVDVGRAHDSTLVRVAR